ncbi:MAG: hypothetical protein ACOH5I_07895 [Oligoflexus sp.]
MAKGRRSEWQVKNIELVKQQVKLDLDAVQEVHGVKERFQAIMNGIRRYESTTEAKDLLLLYVYTISALVHHKNYGGLQQSQIKKLASLAYSLLQMQDIQPETSQLGFLYGEIHMALSQIFRKSGEHLTAAWEQQVSHHVAKKNPPGGMHYQALAKAIRAMRLGQISRALHEYNIADSSDIPERQQETARLGRIRCLRFMGRLAASCELIDLSLQEVEQKERFRLELEWEKICIEATSSQDLNEMIASVHRKGRHYRAVYIMEAYLWALAVSQRKWLEKLPKISTIQRNKSLQTRELGFFSRVMLQLEECQDSNIPLVVRIKSLGNIVQDINQFIAIDRQLLFYVAAARWLAKIQSPTLAAMMLGEYEGFCRKITHGKCADIFQIAGDLMNRPWYEEASDLMWIDHETFSSKVIMR